MSANPEFYLQRAVELETAAARMTDKNIKAGLEELARSFREMANLAAMSQQQQASDAEIEGLAERIVGRPTH